MIDDEKIRLVCDRALKNSGFNNNAEAYPYIRGFYDCAKWAFNEFRKDLWHSIKEKPEKEKVFLYQTSCYGFGLKQIADTKDWNFTIKYQNAIQWLYIDDLLPKTQKGGNHD